MGDPYGEANSLPSCCASLGVPKPPAEPTIARRKQFSIYNFEKSNSSVLIQHFNDAEKECSFLLEDKITPLPLPAYEQCIKASHIFNLLDARGVISVSERQAYILRVRNMSRSCCLAWMDKSNV